MNSAPPPSFSCGPIVLTSNSAWNLRHFRGPLIAGLQVAGYDVELLVPSDHAETEGYDADHTQHLFPLDRGGVNPVRDIRTIAALSNVIARIRPAALLGFTMKANIYGALAAERKGVPFVPNISGLGTSFIRGGITERVVRLLARRAFRKCPVVFFQNPDDLNLFVTARMTTVEQSRLIPGSGVDLVKFSPADRTAQRSDVLQCLYIGRLIADKGVRELVAAAHILKARNVPVRINLLGDGDPLNATAIPERELQGWRDDGVVTLLGASNDVAAHLARSDMVVLPSYREGLPRVLLEGAASGLPLIATDVPGCREVVKHGDTGLLCAARDPVALANAIEAMVVMSASKRKAMGQRARSLVEQEYSCERVVRAYLDVLDGLGVRVG